MRRKKLSKIRGIAERLADVMDIPGYTLPWGMDVEITNDRDVFVTGCTSISEYTEDRIEFCGSNMKIVVVGREFELSAFADGRVRVRGKVKCVTIDRGDMDA